MVRVSDRRQRMSTFLALGYEVESCVQLSAVTRRDNCLHSFCLFVFQSFRVNDFVHALLFSFLSIYCCMLCTIIA